MSCTTSDPHFSVWQVKTSIQSMIWEGNQAGSCLLSPTDGPKCSDWNQDSQIRIPAGFLINTDKKKNKESQNDVYCYTLTELFLFNQSLWSFFKSLPKQAAFILFCRTAQRTWTQASSPFEILSDVHADRSMSLDAVMTSQPRRYFKDFLIHHWSLCCHHKILIDNKKINPGSHCCISCTHFQCKHRAG